MSIKLIVGLGNPEEQYKNTRHNLGFLVIDKLREKLELPDLKEEKKFNSMISSQDKLILAQPLTYMNNSGQAVQAIANFYKITPEEILVIQDDLDLPLGEIRQKSESSAGGHNGIQSIIDQLGSNKFHRIKIGITTPDRSPQMDSADYVLQNFSSEEMATIKKSIDEAVSLVQSEYLSQN